MKRDEPQHSTIQIDYGNVATTIRRHRCPTCGGLLGGAEHVVRLFRGRLHVQCTAEQAT